MILYAGSCGCFGRSTLLGALLKLLAQRARASARHRFPSLTARAPAAGSGYDAVSPADAASPADAVRRTWPRRRAKRGRPRPRPSTRQRPTRPPRARTTPAAPAATPARCPRATPWRRRRPRAARPLAARPALAPRRGPRPTPPWPAPTPLRRAQMGPWRAAPQALAGTSAAVARAASPCSLHPDPLIATMEMARPADCRPVSTHHAARLLGVAVPLSGRRGCAVARAPVSSLAGLCVRRCAFECTDTTWLRARSCCVSNLPRDSQAASLPLLLSAQAAFHLLVQT